MLINHPIAGAFFDWPSVKEIGKYRLKSAAPSLVNPFPRVDAPRSSQKSSSIPITGRFNAMRDRPMITEIKSVFVLR